MIHYASSARDSPSVVSTCLAAFDAVSLRVLNEHDYLREPEKHEIKKKKKKNEVRSSFMLQTAVSRAEITSLI